MAIDFVIEAEDLYAPDDLPVGQLNLDGGSYPIHCPKDSLPLLLARLQRQADGGEVSGEVGEELILQLLLAVFDPEDAARMLEAVIDPGKPKMSLRFVVALVQRIQKQYEPLLAAQYADMGVENPMAPQPQDRLPSSRKPGAPRARKAAGAPQSAPKASRAGAPKKTAARAAAARS